MAVDPSASPAGWLRGRLTERVQLALALALVLVFIAACSAIDVLDVDGGDNSRGASPGSGDATKPPPSATPSPPAEPEADPIIGPVPPEQWDAMVAAGMVRPGCPVTERGDLRRLDIGYIDFDGQPQRGHLVVNRDTAETTARIFTALFEAKFPIASMQGVENYGGDTRASLDANNTSAYNCRRPDQINAPFLESPHANGRAVDINPLQNPWKDLRCTCWVPSKQYAERTPGPGKILGGDAVVRLFEAEGWIWQNIRVADYMHFDTGYPSAPYQEPGAGQVTS